MELCVLVLTCILLIFSLIFFYLLSVSFAFEPALCLVHIVFVSFRFLSSQSINRNSSAVKKDFMRKLTDVSKEGWLKEANN